MAVYAIVRVDVTDEAVYAEYAKRAGPAVLQYGGEFLVRGGACEHMEGVGRARNVVAKFADMETAKAFYFSPEYQEALSYSAKSSEREYTFVEGV